MRWHPGSALLAIATALAVGLAVGLVIGGGSNGGKTRAEARAATVEKEVRARLRTAEARAADLMRQVKRLSAQGVVPSFVGKRIAVVEGERSLGAYKWKLRTTDRSSARAPGTVLSQSPAAGATLKAGRSITVVIAKKAPLRPKRWVAVRRLTGAGATRTRPITIPRRVMARLVYEMPQNGSNAMVLYRADTASGELLFNTVGPRRGIVNLREPGRFYLEVTGRFRIEVQAFTRPR